MAPPTEADLEKRNGCTLLGCLIGIAFLLLALVFALPSITPGRRSLWPLPMLFFGIAIAVILAGHLCEKVYGLLVDRFRR
jgi:hypothetical protein